MKIRFKFTVYILFAFFAISSDRILIRLAADQVSVQIKSSIFVYDFQSLK